MWQKYNPLKIEKKWQKIWEKEKVFFVKDFAKGKKKRYVLAEFPYPSGEGLHTGHIRTYTAMDIISRKYRAQGFNVLFPIGWDAFGLPTENYAIKTGIHPAIVTKNNVKNIKRQLKLLGFSFDWSREINTSDPDYYKWTQWMFLQMYKKGLAYKAKTLINWCPSCKIGLANEEVINEACERCGTSTLKKEKEQWMLAITKYADRLLKDLKDVDYLEQIKAQQKNWIGRSEGVEIKFQIPNSKFQIPVFTTRADTLFGATYLVLAPEHTILKNPKSKIQNPKVQQYIDQVKKKKDIERTAVDKIKTGVFTGLQAIHPLTGEKLPIWVADYVLMDYGFGAVMAVPAHDERDWDFAKKYNLPIKGVIKSAKEKNPADKVFIEKGILENSGNFNGLTSEEAVKRITKELQKNGLGKKFVQYRLRDWIFSRQRYWGEPIPIIFCEKCGEVPVPEKDLPVKLPNVKKYQPTQTGESPLAAIEQWVNVKCPVCKGKAKRETDTMPNWAGSSWYYLTYIMRGISNFSTKGGSTFGGQFPISKYKKVFEYWMPVDWYNGGMEHATLHLLYSRFWHKFLYDIGAVNTLEPYQKRTAQGMVLAADGRKMSKSFGNVVNPDEIVSRFGADTLRIYEMFMGPFDQAISWDSKAVNGISRFLGKVWKLQFKKIEANLKPDRVLSILLQKTIKKVTEDIEAMKFNTAIAALMVLNNEMQNLKILPRELYKIFLKLLNPFAPHISEEMVSIAQSKYGKNRAKLLSSDFQKDWPVYNKKLVQEEEAEFIIQINGKFRGRKRLPCSVSEDEAKKAVLEMEQIKKWLINARIKKIVFIPCRLINFVVA